MSPAEVPRSIDQKCFELLGRYDRSACNRTISPQPKVANHAIDTVIIEATNRNATALLLVLAANMHFSCSGDEVQQPELRARVPNGTRFRSPMMPPSDGEFADREFCDFDSIATTLADLNDPLRDDLSNWIVSIY